MVSLFLILGVHVCSCSRLSRLTCVHADGIMCDSSSLSFGVVFKILFTRNWHPSQTLPHWFAFLKCARRFLEEASCVEESSRDRTHLPRHRGLWQCFFLCPPWRASRRYSPGIPPPRLLESARHFLFPDPMILTLSSVMSTLTKRSMHTLWTDRTWMFDVLVFCVLSRMSSFLSQLLPP